MNFFTSATAQLNSAVEYERQQDRARIEEFQKKHGKINGKSILGPFLRFIVREHFFALLVLGAILFSWTLLKLPYFSYNFTGEHELKYNSYVEPALHMVEMSNPFWNQKKYLANPVSNPQGIYYDFSHIPILEWTLAASYVLLPGNSIEVKTRLVTHSIGILTLLLAYVFFRYWVSKSTALLTVTLLALNPIITFASFVTVYDGLLLLCTFLTLALLSEALQQKDPLYLFSAGLSFGLGFAMKDSIAVWLLPSVVIMLWLRRDTVAQFFHRSIFFAFFASLPYLMLLSGFQNLPLRPYFSLSLLLGWMLFLLVLVRFRSHLFTWYSKIFTYIRAHKAAHTLFWIFVVGMAAFYWAQSHSSRTAEEFLTDKDLIFYWPMYQELLQQLQEFLTPPILWLGLAGVVSTYLMYRQGSLSKGINHLVFVLGISSLVYFVAASKVIFFHNYYTQIILVFFSFSAALACTYFVALLRNRTFQILLIANGLIWFFPISYQAIHDHLARQRPQYTEALAYLRQQSAPDDLYIDESFVMSLTIGSGRPSFANVDIVNSTKLEESIARRGLAKTMRAYHIRYIITANAEPDYSRLAPLFTQQDLQSSYYRRTDIIKSRLDPEYAFFSDLTARNDIVLESRLKEKFRLEYSTGYYNFFSFVE